MRIDFVGAIVVSLIVVGCSRTEATAGDVALASVGTAGHADAAAPAAAPAATPAATPAAEREITIPAGTRLTVTLDTPVGSDTSRVEEPVTAHLTRAVRLQGETVIAEGSRVTGVVTAATRSAKVKGRAHVAMRFDALTPRGDDQRYAIRTAAVGRTAQATKQKDALEIGGPAAGGAIIGALLGGKKGAAIGAGVGGGAGTAVVLSTRGKEVRLGKGAALTIRLTAPLTLRVRG